VKRKPRQEVRMDRPAEIRLDRPAEIRLAHLSDVHLDYRLGNREAKPGVNQRTYDVGRTFYQVIQQVVQFRPHLVVIAGDLFDKPRPSNFSMVVAISSLRKLRSELPDCAIYILGGNHDSPKNFTGTSAIQVLAEAIPNCQAIPVEPASARVVINDVPVHLAFIPSRFPSSYRDPRDQPVHVPDLSAKVNLLFIHGIHEKVLPLVTASASWLVHPSCYQNPFWDYTGWGDYHEMLKLGEREFYAGAIDRTTTNVWAESDSKGWLAVTLNPTENDLCRLQVRHVTSPQVRPHVVIKAESVDDLMKKDYQVPDGAMVRVVVPYRLDEVKTLRKHLSERLSHALQTVIAKPERERVKADTRTTPKTTTAGGLSIEERWRQFVEQKFRNMTNSEKKILSGISLDEIVERGLEALAGKDTAEKREA